MQAAKRVGFKQEQKYFILNFPINKSQIQIASLSLFSKKAKTNSNKTGDIRAVLVHSANKDPNFTQENISSNNTKSDVRLKSGSTNRVNENLPMKTVMGEVKEVKSNSTSTLQHLGPQSLSELRSDSKLDDANTVQQNTEIFSDLLGSKIRTHRPKRNQESRILTRPPVQEQEKSTQSFEPKEEHKKGLKKYIEGTRCTCFTTVHCECCVTLHLYEPLSPHKGKKNSCVPLIKM